MNPIARELNDVISSENPHLYDMLSAVGKKLFFPKGILSQSAEAKEKAHKLNATIGIAKEKNRTMYIDSVMTAINDIRPSESITYAPSFGIPALRKAWQAEIYAKNPSLSGQQISLPVVTCGITHGISIFADVWTDPGDEVILPDMMWGNYNMILNVRKGAEILNYPIFSESGGYHVAAFEKTVKGQAAKRDKIIVLLNFPHNPTGYSLSEKEAEQIADILTEIAEGGTNVIAVTDDSYFGLFYKEETAKESIFARLCGRSERLLAVKLDGATKENYVWGLRVGFISYGCGGRLPDHYKLFEALEKKTAGCVRGNISNASHLSQTILFRSMQDDNYAREKKEKFEILKKRADRVKSVLKDSRYNEFWDVYPFNSGYFMCLRLKSIEAEKLRLHLLDKYGVGLIALGKNDLRVAFSCIEEEDIQELFDTILQGARDLKAMA
jgi:aspartate/methionine/tyrosine aminotransferase